MKSKLFDAMCDAAASKVEKTVDANGFVTPTEISEYVNAGIEEVWDMMNQAIGSHYFAKEASFTTTANTSVYSLGSDFYNLLSGYVTSGSHYYELEKWEMNEEFLLRNLNADDESIFYRVIGSNSVSNPTDNIELLPVPKAGMTVTYRYTPQPPTLAYGSVDTFVGHPAAIEYAELIATKKILDKEQSDPQAILVDLQRVGARLKKMASARDRMRPARVRDTKRDRARLRRY